MQHKAHQAPQSKILKPFWQYGGKQFKKYSNQRDGIRKYNGCALRILQAIMHSNGKHPVAVPIASPSQVVLRQVSPRHQPVCIGGIQNIDPIYADKGTGRENGNNGIKYNISLHSLAERAENSLAPDNVNPLIFAFVPANIENQPRDGGSVNDKIE